MIATGLLTFALLAAPASPNPLLAPWPGPYGGVPPFDRVRVADLGPALDAALAEHLAEVERVAADPAPPTFDNTLVALERAGRTLDRVQAVLGVYTSTLADDAVQAVEREAAPKLAAHRDRIAQNAQLFRRVAAVYEARARLDPEAQRLAWYWHKELVRAGARLEGPAKQRLGELNQQLAALQTRFSQNVLADENDRLLVLEREEDLAGLPESVRAAAASAAASRGHPGKWAVLNTRSSVEPFLAASTRRDLREKVFQEFTLRGDHGDLHDNNAVVAQILALRAERAKLLGYPTHAHWRLEDQMARTPERAAELMEAVWPAAVARAREEVADMQAVADAEAAAGRGPKLTLAPWDYRFYAEKVRKARYDLDAEEVKPYLQLEKLREGMFDVAGRLFGFRFAPVPAGQVPVQHPDVRVWEVTDGAGQHVGLWYFDPYARKGKRSGAWMNAYRRQQRVDGPVTTIVSNNANFVKGKPGEPVLVSWEDATTLFHEFGHALHGLSSAVRYPSLAGTNVARDYVEFPSQLLEHWLSTPEVLARYAVHFRTGQPIPPALVQRIERAKTFNEGFRTVEYLSAALVDLKLHLAGARPVDPRAFERETLAALGMPREIVMRHRTPQFLHVFGGDGYSAGYYSYLWAETLSADAFAAFTEAGGPWDAKVAARLRGEIFTRGNTRDPAEAYRAFRGRDPGITALMRERGFPLPAAAAPGAATVR
ncbi:M3 family metallopeptidase [Anaeromyxobacter diazotrophicus]|uniref:Peptidase M3 n=1 Tax=Anaeromyxobacter diazotrophicus TaxID=2590199 RepID=A0A7I9VQA5_9BACT|nr:M3 family metallopeptidase [Anaeromyxobacter diazotrophicus]GEJ58157.1 peptidase M3 [Anaeromyxobacter diazotrophicus]